jgi:hypothetical protein
MADDPLYDPEDAAPYPRKPQLADWWPGDETGSTEYHEQMFTITDETPGFVRWKILSAGLSVARSLAAARNHGRASWIAEYGADPSAWPLLHPPTVLWIPDSATAACFGCLWIDHRVSRPVDAGRAARQHASEFVTQSTEAGQQLLAGPIRVWCREGPIDEPGPTTD